MRFSINHETACVVLKRIVLDEQSKARGFTLVPAVFGIELRHEGKALISYTVIQDENCRANLVVLITYFDPKGQVLLMSYLRIDTALWISDVANHIGQNARSLQLELEKVSAHNDLFG